MSSLFSQVIYCRGYSGEEPPLPIPNREVKLTIADGTDPPVGRVGSCRASRGPRVQKTPGPFLSKSGNLRLWSCQVTAVNQSTDTTTGKIPRPPSGGLWPSEYVEALQQTPAVLRHFCPNPPSAGRDSGRFAGFSPQSSFR